jgi:hypothetical protein
MESKSEHALKIVQIIAEVIRECSPVVSGHLYAMVMSHISYNDFNSALLLLKRINLIRELDNELFWICDNNEKRI